MFLSLLVSPIARSLCCPLFVNSRTVFASKIRTLQMGHENLQLIGERRNAQFRLCNVSGYNTDLLEIHAEEPTLHVLFIPGNPGAISFYIDFLESLYEILGGTASVTAIGHISHTKKMNFIKHNLQDIEVPVILVGHSIGSYISIEMFRRSPGRVIYCIGLYPFLAVNAESSTQSFIREISASPFLCATVSAIVALLGLLPTWASKFLVKKSLGKSWSVTAVEALCSDLLQYHTTRNVLFMAMTEFKRLVEIPDWAFMREKQSQIAFLFGLDDHWGPLQMFDEISKQVPGANLAIEREGHSHAFSCTEAGSLWAAQHVASLIKSQISR